MKKIFLAIITLIIYTNINAQFWITSSGEARLWTSKMGPYDNTMLTVPNHSYSKNYVVSMEGLYGSPTFFVYGYGRVYSKGYSTLSDSTQKENIKPIDNALSNLRKINGIKFNYIDKADKKGNNQNRNVNQDNLIIESKDKQKKHKKTEIGLLAQNVANIFPEAVDTLEDGRLTITYDAMVGVIIEAVKEQQIQIETLQGLAYAQEQDIVALKKELKDCCNVNKNNSKLKSGSIASDGLSEENQILKKSAELFENSPNPFTLDTEIRCFIPEDSENAIIIIHDLQGVEIESHPVNNKGYCSINISGSKLNAGMYVYTLVVDNKIIDSKRMLLTAE